MDTDFNREYPAVETPSGTVCWRKIMKRFMIVCLLVMTFSSSAFSDEIPPGIRYVKASDEINMKAQKKLERVFSQTSVKLDDLFGRNVTCGPLPWAQIKNMESLRNHKVIAANFVIPLSNGSVQTLEGAVFRTKEEISAFCRTMEGYLKTGGPYRIRKPNAEELQIYWAMIPYDIEEPIFVADNKDHKLLLHFMGDSASVFWIGDLQGMKRAKSRQSY
ncbi:hypothetical protein HZA56_20025 [Candidatus Poribacteria bacterium]|nr:hypothetical protein [Candidatus Poribacteria bacterium]